MPFDPTDHPHRRRNPLTGEWVLVSPHRAKRPWLGEVAAHAPDRPPKHDPDCQLCPGGTRANGERNPDYDGVFVFSNDFPALLTDTPEPPNSDALFQNSPARGETRVICYSPSHARTLPEMDHQQVWDLVDIWCAQSAQLSARWDYVQVFENKGAMMGASNPHPHGQIWAGDFVPDLVAREDAAQHDWLAQRDEVLLDAVVRTELASGDRVVEATPHWLAIVPYWASWPFEILLINTDGYARLADLEANARSSLADILQRITARYDALFGVTFPYSFGWHQAPGRGDPPKAWRLHAHFYPPLLRSATVRKFMVGYEMLAEAQRDLTPEQATARLRAVTVAP